MKDMAKVLQRFIICSLEQDPCLKNMESKDSTKEDPGEGRSKSERRKTVELPQAFDIANSALPCIFAAVCYQQTTVAKLAQHRAVLEMDVHF